MNGRALFSNDAGGRPVPADLRAMDRGLEIRDRRDGLMLALWSYADLLPLAPPPGRADPTKLRLACKIDPGSELVIADAAMIAGLRRRIPSLAGRRQRRPLMVAGAVCAGCLGLLLLYQTLLWLPRPLARIVPPSWEVRLGQGVALQLAGAPGAVCRGPGGEAALDALLRRLAEANQLTFPVTIQVLRSSAIDAVALPGGRVLLSDGLIKEAEGPDEVATALAGELSHLSLRQVTEQALRQAGGAWAVLMVSGEANGWVAGSLARLSHPAYGRKADAEAEAMAVRMLERADISVRGMGNFFRRLDRRAPRSDESDHPVTDARALRPILQPFTRPALTESAWHALRAICD